MFEVFVEEVDVLGGALRATEHIQQSGHLKKANVGTGCNNANKDEPIEQTTNTLQELRNRNSKTTKRTAKRLRNIEFHNKKPSARDHRKAIMDAKNSETRKHNFTSAHTLFWNSGPGMQKMFR